MAVAATAQDGAELLNSERIEARFGSYGIEVLQSDAVVRVSDLFSGAAGTESRTTRTLALVEYPSSVPPAIAEAHSVILQGGSIGATFRDAGWAVIKTHLYFGERASTPELERRMRLDSPGDLAVHVYALAVERNRVLIPYARILEVHHPDYLAQPELRGIYAPVGFVPESAAGQSMLAELARRGF